MFYLFNNLCNIILKTDAICTFLTYEKFMKVTFFNKKVSGWVI